MIKALDRNYRDKLHRLLSVMLPIICTQIAIMGMKFLTLACPVRLVMWTWPEQPSAAIFGCPSKQASVEY